jgi:hypothetical protein
MSPLARGSGFGPGALLRDICLVMEIEVELIGEEIVVTKPGTTFLLAYRKALRSRVLF